MAIRVTDAELQELLAKGAVLGPAVRLDPGAPVAGAPAPVMTQVRIVGVTEAQFTRQVIELARHCGWLVAHFRTAQTKKGHWVTPVQGDGKGFPDLVLVRERVIYVELKCGNNRLSPAQRRWRKALIVAGQHWYEWRTTMWPEIEKVLKG